MPEKILIVDDDVDTLRLVGLMLQKQGYQIVAAPNGQQGLELAFAEIPQLVLLDVMMPGMDGYEVARRLRADTRTASIPILMFTAKSQLDDKVTGFEAGADDYLTKPTHPAELQAHVRALLARSGKGKINPPTAPKEQPGYLIGVLAARGGFGVSTVALNLASSLERKNPSEVILAEYRPGQGVFFTDLNLSEATGLSSLLSANPAEITRQRVRDALSKHASGLHVLASSPRPRDGMQVNNIQHFEVILNRMTFMTHFVVIDLGSGLNPLNQKLLPLLSEVVVVVEPFENSIKQSRALIEDMVSLGIEKTRIQAVANYRTRTDLQLSVQQVQDRLNFPVAANFTPAPELMMQAIRVHNSAILTQTESITAQQYANFTAKIETRAPKPAKAQG